jgi:hypothetical protein
VKSLCIFCQSPATKGRGEHVFDDWLNRKDGRQLKDKYEFSQFSRDGVLDRKYKVRKIDVAKPVVCDSCNHGWMSDLTNQSKAILEGFIRYERPATILSSGIDTIAAWAFMKAAVIDTQNPKRFFSPGTLADFRRTRQLPDGSQIWIAWFRSRHKMIVRCWNDIALAKTGVFRGYEFYYFTYAVGHFALQFTYPRWTKGTRRRPPIPSITQDPRWDNASVLIWPDVAAARWPPNNPLTDAGIVSFCERFGSNMRSPVRLNTTF